MKNQFVGAKNRSITMNAATHRLRAEEVYFETMTPYHLKSDELNFYPSRGTIYRDGDKKALPETGIDAFVLLLKSRAERTRNMVSSDGSH